MSAPEVEGGQDHDDILGFPGDGKSQDVVMILAFTLLYFFVLFFTVPTGGYNLFFLTIMRSKVRKDEVILLALALGAVC
jgi:hypothetical protein